jgi:hypothetical protein
MANHASTRTTQLYDRRRDEVSLDEVEDLSRSLVALDQDGDRPFLRVRAGRVWRTWKGKSSAPFVAAMQSPNVPHPGVIIDRPRPRANGSNAPGGGAILSVGIKCHSRSLSFAFGTALPAPNANAVSRRRMNCEGSRTRGTGSSNPSPSSPPAVSQLRTGLSSTMVARTLARAAGEDSPTRPLSRHRHRGVGRIEHRRAARARGFIRPLP